MLEFIPYTEEWIGSVHEFNERMAAGGLVSELRFPEQLDTEYCQDPKRPLFREYFLAVEGPHVRGVYFITHEEWLVNGFSCRLASYRLSTSEGFVNPKYKGVGRALLYHALSRNPLLYALGHSVRTRPLPRSLVKEGFPMVGTPFYFRCFQARKVLSNLTWYRKRIHFRLALDLANRAGAPSVITALQSLRTQKPGARSTFSIVPDFGDWADDLWERARSTYSMLALRNSRMLCLRYPVTDNRFLRLAIRSGSETVGWAVLLATSMHDHRHFGDLRVGSIVDCLALPDEEQNVIHAATQVLKEQNVDLIVSNQSHRNWCLAFERNGFLRGPTNRFFTPSPQLALMLQPFAKKFPLTHLTRGDAAGPVHL